MKVRKLCPELAEKARAELGEDPKGAEDGIQHIKDWLAKQPHLKTRTDDQWILSFLRGCKFSLEKAKEKIDLYYTCRTSCPEFWRYKYNEEKFTEIMNLGIILALPKIKNVTSPRVVLVRPGCYDGNKYHISEIFSVSNIIQEIMQVEDDVMMVSGALTIIDLQGVNTAHFMQFTPSVMKKLVATGQDAAPIRQKGTHYFNTPTGIETIFNLLKPLLNEKNRSRLYVHNKNVEEMYKYIPKEVLPVEYGGEGGTIPDIIEYWKNKVKECGPWIEEGMDNGTDESKRPGKPKTAEELFGVEGSFRQLEFD